MPFLRARFQSGIKHKIIFYKQYNELFSEKHIALHRIYN